MIRVEPYEAYVKYLALKSHFSDKNYDYFKYNGKVKAWRATFEQRKDKYFFYKLSKKKDPVEYLVANFVGSNDFYIGNIRADESDQIYMDYKKRKENWKETPASYLKHSVHSAKSETRSNRHTVLGMDLSEAERKAFQNRPNKKVDY